MKEQLVKALKVRLKQLEAQFNDETIPYVVHEGHHIRDRRGIIAGLPSKRAAYFSDILEKQ